METVVTFESMPKLISEMNRKLDSLMAERPVREKDFLMTMDQLREYLHDNPARQTVYGWVNDRKIPCEKHGKRLWFRKSSIDNWQDNGRQV